MIDPEKIPDAPRDSVEFAGVTIQSRYGKRAELETMMTALDWVGEHDPAVHCMVKSVWCDSKACACYTVECCHPDEIAYIADVFDHAFRSADGGHNGVYVRCGAAQAWADPWWHGDFEGDDEDHDR